MAVTPATNCDACGALVFWLAHERTGKLAPIDYEPTEAGNVEVVSTNAGDRYRVIGKPQDVPATSLRYAPHFASCPAAERFRRPTNDSHTSRHHQEAISHAERNRSPR